MSFFSFLKSGNKSNIKVYNSYGDALQVSSGYEESDIVELVLQKTLMHLKNIKNPFFEKNKQLLQNISVVNEVGHLLKNKPLRILDIGGACGALFFELSEFTNIEIEKYYVVETPLMVSKARAKIKSENLEFYSKLEEVPNIDSIDLFIAQGVVQYFDAPIEFLKIINKLPIDFKYFSRTEWLLKLHNPIIFIQEAFLYDNGPGGVPSNYPVVNRKTNIPHTFVPLELFENCLLTNHCLIKKIEETPQAFKKISILKSIQVQQIGFLFKKI